VSGCEGDTRHIRIQHFWEFTFFFDMRAKHFWGFPLYHPALFGISILSPGTMGIPTLPPAGWKKIAFQLFNNYKKPNFWCWRDKKNYNLT